MKNTVRNITKDFLKANSKAIAGLLSGSLAGYYSQVGISADMNVETAVYTLISGLLGYLIVWVSPANQQKRK